MEYKNGKDQNIFPKGNGILHILFAGGPFCPGCPAGQSLSVLSGLPDAGAFVLPDDHRGGLSVSGRVFTAWTDPFETGGQPAADVRIFGAALLFCSMVITNDVTLITFVPFTVLVFRMVKMEDKVLKLIVLETIAANLGSMATPIGNPQNLYLYSASGLSTSQFVFAVIPYAGLSLILLLAVLLIQKNEPLADTAEEISQTKELEGKRMTAVLPYLCLLLLCLLVVFRILPFLPVLICVGAAVLFINRRLYASVDYFLLLTFLCFFVFIGNVKRMPGISGLLFSLVDGRELWAGILTSQVISNVPAAILLSGFTDNFAALLTAVNLGGLGTLIASLASLISFQSYTRAYPEKKGAFMKVFTVWNLTFLVILAAAAAVLNGMSGRS